MIIELETTKIKMKTVNKLNNNPEEHKALVKEDSVGNLSHSNWDKDSCETPEKIEKVNPRQGNSIQTILWRWSSRSWRHRTSALITKPETNIGRRLHWLRNVCKTLCHRKLGLLSKTKGKYMIKDSKLSFKSLNPKRNFWTPPQMPKCWEP